MRNVYEYSQCITFDEWMAVSIGMQVISIIANMVLGALVIENRIRLASLLKAKGVQDD